MVILSDGYGGDDTPLFPGGDLRHRALKGKDLPSCSIGLEYSVLSKFHSLRSKTHGSCKLLDISKSRDLCSQTSAQHWMTCFTSQQYNCSTGQPFPAGPACLDGLHNEAADNPFRALVSLFSIHIWTCCKNAQAHTYSNITSVYCPVLVFVKKLVIWLCEVCWLPTIDILMRGC